MTHTNNLTAQPVSRAALIKSLLFGAGIALLVIGAFVLSVNHPRPEWGELWMMRPLIITPLAGAAGSAFYFFVYHFFAYRGAIRKASGGILGLTGYIVALWLGVVLGLAGTFWH